jgi:thiamine-monophosphate kinase
MQETRLIQKIRRFAGRTPRNSQIVAGIGDDCAIMRPSADFDFVFTTDFTIEDRHFKLTNHTGADVGVKSLARSLSDLAAMGAEPVFCTVSLALPASLSSDWFDDFYQGFTECAREYKISLAGGDLAQSSNVVVDVMCCGSVPHGMALLRSGARPGDGIYVTGELGFSALGFELQQGEAWLRHKRPVPRLAIGIELRGLATSAMDLSDGLSFDLQRLCEESNVGAEVHPLLPIAKNATLAHALDGGEDYELLFTASPGSNVPERIAGVSVRKIGTITSHSGKITYEGNILEPLGFDHFR